MSGVMIALVFLATYFTRIPTPLPGGYFNLGDAVIMMAAAFLGPAGGLIAGSIGSGFADIAAAAFIYAPITLVVKGIEGLVVGLLISKYIRSMAEKRLAGTHPVNNLPENDQAEGTQAADNQPVYAALGIRLALSLAVGAIIMVAGYFFGEAYILSLFDKAFGLAAAAGELVPNLIQGGLSAVLAYFLILVLSKVVNQK